MTSNYGHHMNNKESRTRTIVFTTYEDAAAFDAWVEETCIVSTCGGEFDQVLLEAAGAIGAADVTRYSSVNKYKCKECSWTPGGMSYCDEHRYLDWND